MRLDTEIGRWYAVADDASLPWEEKLGRYRALADGYYEADRFAEFCERHLPHADDRMREYVESPEFDHLLVTTVQRAFPAHEHEELVAHYRGLLGAWAAG